MTGTILYWETPGVIGDVPPALRGPIAIVTLVQANTLHLEEDVCSEQGI
jgi:hypothetical protein